MSNFPSYPTRSFSETQKFFVLDPQTGTPSFVLGSDLVNFLTPGTSFVFSESTRVSAQASNYKVGNLIQTAGAVTEGDGLASGFLVVPGGEGDFAMQNGNDLLVIRGDDLLREQLKEGVVRMPDLAAMESTPGRFDGDAARLVSGTGRDGDFRWDSSDLSATLVLASATSDSVDDTTDTINDADHPFSDGDGVITQTTVNGLTAQTIYWVVNSTAGSYQLSATFGGGAVDLTGTANVTIDHLLDPLQGVYVTPSSDKSGGSGAWVRDYRGRVDLSWFDPEGDGLTDNSLAIRCAWILSTAYSSPAASNYSIGVSPGLKIPSGAFVFSENAILNNASQHSSLIGRDFSIVGDGQGQSVLIFKPTVSGALLYDQSLSDSPTFDGLEFSDLQLIFDDSDNGGSPIHGFLCDSSPGAATQSFKFSGFKFKGIESTVFMELSGTVNESENRFINSELSTLKTLLSINNPEALNHEIVATDVELLYGPMIIANRGGTLQMFGGSVIFAADATDEAPILFLGGPEPDPSHTSSTYLFEGVRAEFRGINSRALLVEESTAVLEVEFRKCVFGKVDFGQNFAKSTIDNGSRITFSGCILPSESSGSRFEFIDNPDPKVSYAQDGLLKSYLLFDGCQSFGDETTAAPYADFSSLTGSDINHGQVVEYRACENVPNGVSYGTRYGAGRTYSPVSGIKVPFRGLTFPYGDGASAAEIETYFNVEIPYGAFLESLTVSRASFAGFGSVDYQVEFVDEAEFNSPGTGTIFGTMPVQKYDQPINWELRINDRLFGTRASRTIWLRLAQGVTATSGVKADKGVVYAHIF